MSFLRRVESTFSRPAVAIPTLTLTSAALLTGLGRLIFGEWLLTLLVVLGVLLLFLCGFVLWSMITRERAKQIHAGLELAPPPVPQSEVSEDRVGSLEDRFVRGVSDWGRSSRARQLPWYLVIGESGSGKTRALADSGLELPADTSRFVDPGPTRSIAWWPTNQAILLDTAGRYLEDESSETRREWRRLLRLVRRYGRRVSLQGIVAAVPLRRLLAEGEAELQARAHRLRRRLNEIGAELRIDAPIYLLVTEADAIEGLVELAGALPHARLDEALGWTNPYRRYSEPSALLRKGFGPTLERIERLLPEVLLREADPERRRRLFLFPRELSAAIERIGGFLDRAFGRSVYGSIPFLRGVYLASTEQTGTTSSAYLEKLGHAWALHPVDGFRPQRGLFLRDLFRRVLIDPEEATLATPARELGPTVRRLVLGFGGAATAAVIAGLVVSVYGGHGSLRAIRSDLIPARLERPTLDTLARLGDTIVAVEARHASPWRRMGLYGPVSRAVERAKITLVERFESLYEGPTKQQMELEARQVDERAFGALSALALDVTWLASDRSAEPPDLGRFLTCRLCGPRAAAIFPSVYALWGRWAPQRVEARIVREREALAQLTPALLRLENMDRWCAAEPGLCRSVRFEDFSLQTPGGCTAVPGVYTQLTWDELIARLVDAVRASGRASQVDVERFMREYRQRYAREWETFLRCLPAPARAELPEESVYLEMLETLGRNTGPGSQWSEQEPAPRWFGAVQELIRTEPRAEGEVPPGVRYRAYLDKLTTEIQRVRAQPQGALGEVRRAGSDPASIYQEGLALVSEVARTEGGEERAVRTQLARLLELPVLNGFSATVAVARGVLDEQWRDQIADPYAGSLDSLSSVRALYDPQSGALARFEREALDGFYQKVLLRDRAMGFGGRFRAWLDGARELQRGFFSERSLRMAPVPGALRGMPGAFLTDRELELRCPGGPQTFRHSDGGSGGENVFRWTPGCDVVRLRLWIQRSGAPAKETLEEKTWSGPFALGHFLRAARRVQGRFVWTLDYGNGVSAEVSYRVRGAESILDLDHRTPPRSLAD